MDRQEMVTRIENGRGEWDIIIIGGGATGLGAAVDAASRGYKTLLLEAYDFSKGTSSRSTKIVHGGVRYLRHGELRLVREALRERGLLAKNAPHLVRPMEFVIPVYNHFDTLFYGTGLKMYDILAGRLGFGSSKILSREKTMEYLPTIEQKKLRAGIRYFDGQFDDSRLAVNLAQTAAEHDATIFNYARVDSILKEKGRIAGVAFADTETNKTYEVKGKAIINATGNFTDTIRRLADRNVKSLIVHSQGSHIVVDKSFLPGTRALLVPKTKDGRVLFAIPWYDHLVVGTTDGPVDEPKIEPRPTDEEIGYILDHMNLYFNKKPASHEIHSVFAGLRPLLKTHREKRTSVLPRTYTIFTSESGLISVAGGKWTTYRSMAKDIVDHAEKAAQFTHRPSPTHNLQIHGWSQTDTLEECFNVYGSDSKYLYSLIRNNKNLDGPIHDELPYKKVQVVWAVRAEMARTVEDVLSRRTRALLLNAKASIEAAPEVASLMANEMEKNEQWERKQFEVYSEIAKRYRLD